MYEVRYQKKAAQILIRISRNIAIRIRDKVELVARRPYESHVNVKPLKGRKNCFRLRIGGWRIVYLLDDQSKTLLVAKIEQRGQVYR